MASARKSEIGLLKDVVALFHEAAVFLATGDSPVAQRARLKLEGKGPDDEAFFTNLSCDFEELGTILEGIPDTFTDKDGEVNAGMRKVLSVLQDDYLNESRHISAVDDSDDSASDDEPARDDPYRSLQKLLIEFRHPQFGPSQDEKVVWLCGETKLAKTRSKHRKALLHAIKKCTKLLGPFGKTQPVDISWRHDERLTVIWETTLFTDAEKLHQTLADIWECNCFDEANVHQHAMFSFEGTPVAKYSCSAGRLYYRTELQETYGWKHTKFEFVEREQEPSPKRLTVPTSVQLKVANRIKCAPGHFCDNLEHFHEGDMVQITSATSKLQRGTNIKHIKTSFSKELPLTSCFKLPNNHKVYNLSPKRRMMLALYLAYAYLHLSGGAWWPYTHRNSVMLPDQVDIEVPPSAFFAASLVDDPKDKDNSKFELEGYINIDMPSLVAFGRLLLEFYLGRQVIWDKVSSELKQCTDNAFSIEMTAAIEYCLRPNERRSSDKPYTIRGDERLREAFIKNVVLPIQHVLQFGYQVRVQDIFSVPPAPKLSEVATPRRLRSPSPLVSAAGTQIIPHGFCLHDGEDKPSKIEDNSARDAKAYMKQLQECSRTAIFNELCPTEDEKNDLQPVKVAILDTGAYISQELCIHVYDERIKECRTWLTTSDAIGEQIPIGSNDSDGHGTHGTSVLLEATQYSDVNIYVAQIFKGRNEKIVKDEFVDNPTITRIANAIYHAVEKWRVDIISMSFGFPQRIKEIDKAMSFATSQGVLMLAAASNCGGNEKRSWPARDAKVLCIYASDGIGNMYLRNPTALPNKDNFAVLGSCVEGIWPGQDERVRKSGTSTATPICAGISALVMTALRRSQDKYIATAKKQGKNAEKLQHDYEMKMELLGQASSMGNVLRLMLGEGKRGDYDYITPWTLFQKDRSATSMIESILEAIDA